MSLTITVNQLPHSERCIGCNYNRNIPKELESNFLDYNKLCLIGHNAENCSVPQVLNQVESLKTTDFKSLLRNQRKRRANPDCTECGGYGEILIDPATTKVTSCPKCIK